MYISVLKRKVLTLGHILGPNVSHDVFKDASFTLTRCVHSVDILLMVLHTNFVDRIVPLSMATHY